MCVFRDGVGGKMWISGIKVHTITCVCHSHQMFSDGLLVEIVTVCSWQDILVDRQLTVLAVDCHFVHLGNPCQ